jgi:hypothetical protein
LLTILNRTQLLVVGFFLLAWVALVAILVLSPEVYTQTLRKVGWASLTIEASFLIALSALIALMVIGVFRRWRWTFWLLLIALPLVRCDFRPPCCSSPGYCRLAAPPGTRLYLV